jgi:hypothetical protein
MIVYKVVHKETRYGSNAAIYIKQKSIRDFLKLFNYKGLKKYFPKYEKGKIIECVSGSVGLMCFKTLFDCRDFVLLNKIKDSSEIVRVRINKKNVLEDSNILSECGTFPTKLVDQYKYLSNNPPNGTILVKQLYVME